MLRYIILGCVILALLAGCNLVFESDASELNTPAATRTLPNDAPNATGLPTRAATQAATLDNAQQSATLAATPATRVTGGTCKPPANWVEYTIQRGDTMVRIADLTSSSTDELVSANCIENANRIAVGQVIFVPKAPVVPTPIPSPTPRT
jgi:hypothetical protein